MNRRWPGRLIAGATLIMMLAPGAAFGLPSAQVVIDEPGPQSGVPELGAVTVTGSGCSAGDEVVVAYRGEVVASASAGDDGSFAVTFTVPALPEGFDEIEEGTESSIRVTCGGDSAGVVVAVNPATLPFTGLDLTPVALFGGLVIAIGVVMLLASDRARRQQT